MPQRVRLVLIGVVACSFAALAGAFLAAGNSTLAPDPSVGWEGYIRPPGAHVPAFSLRDQDGNAVTAANEMTIYAFIYSHCKDTCPLQVQQIRNALDRLGRDVRVVGVSVDPANDTRASAKAFLIKQQMLGRMSFALGSESELAPVWKAFGIAPQTKGRDHSVSVVITDAAGRQRVGFPASGLTPEGLEHDLRKLGA